MISSWKIRPIQLDAFNKSQALGSLISKVLLMGGNAKNMREKLIIILQSVMSELMLRKRNLNCVMKAGKLGLCDREEMWVSCTSKIGQSSWTCCADVSQNHENKEVK